MMVVVLHPLINLDLNLSEGNTSLSEELSSDACTQLRKLEYENQRLQSLLDQLRDQGQRDANERVSQTLRIMC